MEDFKNKKCLTSFKVIDESYSINYLENPRYIIDSIIKNGKLLSEIELIVERRYDVIFQLGRTPKRPVITDKLKDEFKHLTRALSIACYKDSLLRFNSVQLLLELKRYLISILSDSSFSYENEVYLEAEIMNIDDKTQRESGHIGDSKFFTQANRYNTMREAQIKGYQREVTSHFHGLQHNRTVRYVNNAEKVKDKRVSLESVDMIELYGIDDIEMVDGELKVLQYKDRPKEKKGEVKEPNESSLVEGVKGMIKQSPINTLKELIKEDATLLFIWRVFMMTVFLAGSMHAIYLLTF